MGESGSHPLGGSYCGLTVAVVYMHIKEEYISVARRATAEFIEKKSRFIGHVSSASSEEEAMAFVAEIRRLHPNASHNCYAYVVGLSGQYQKAGDDGEPSGTAGRPMLDVILRQGLVNVVVVATRYFGGILLGTGGLVRAYTETAKIAMEAGGIARTVRCARAMISVDYGLYGKVQRELENRRFPVESADFGSDVTITLRLKLGDVGDFKSWLMDASAATAVFEQVDELYAPVDDGGVLM